MEGISKTSGKQSILLAACIILTSISLIYFIRFIVKPNTGLVVNYPEVVVEKGKVLFSPKTPFSPAVSSGLIPNKDYILEINGKKISSTWDVIKADRGLWSFDDIKVKVLRDGKEKVLTLKPVFNLKRIDWLFTLLLIIALSFTAFYLTYTLPDDKASNFIVLASLFYLVFTGLKPFYYESIISNSLIHLGKVTSWFLVFFALYFPQKKGSARFRITFIVLIILIYSVFFLFRMYFYIHWTISGTEEWLKKYRFLGRLGNIADGLAYIIYLSLLISSYFKSKYSSEKRQIEWILAGILIAIPPYFFLDQLPIILGNSPETRMSMGNFASLFLTFVPLFFIIGLMKHRVFNIKFFATRYIVYGLLALLTFAFFTVLYEPMKDIFSYNYGLPDRISGFLVVTILFIVLFIARAFLISLIERLFYLSHYRRTFQYSASLESKNMELKMIIDELNKEGLKNFQSKKMKELKGIITGIAHRINNPANYIQNALFGLEKGMNRLAGQLGDGNSELPRLLSEMQSYLTIAEEGSLQIRHFIRKLVSLAGSRVSVPAVMSVDLILKNAIVEMQRKYPDAIMKIGKTVSGKIKCYPKEITQAIEYCIENSIEATDNRSIEVKIDAEMHDDDNIVITITDNGPGIDEMNIRKVFDPFFSTKHDHEGLGLYFCKTIVERNGGTVEIESVNGNGTAIKMRFPLQEESK